ncbi:MAG: hypothetical protein U9R27_08705 [Campylobacterota bacterium]|nr:hypothetical protein [Campylobacterota bacterium]
MPKDRFAQELKNRNLTKNQIVENPILLDNGKKMKCKNIVNEQIV